MYRLHGAIHAYGGTTVSARDTADSVITALTPAAWYRNATDVVSSGGFASIWADYASSDVGLVLPGVSGNNASVPDAAYWPVGDIDVQVYATLPDWTPASDMALISRYMNTGNNRSWMLVVAPTTGVLQLYWSLDGVTGALAASTSAPTVSDGGGLWVRVTRASSSGDVKFYTGGSSASPSWSQLGTTVSTTAGSLYDNAVVTRVGAWDGGYSLNGTIYRAIVKDGIGGTTVFDADFSSQAIGAGSFTESSSNAATVTINASGASPAHIGKARDLLQGTGTNQPAYNSTGGIFTFDGADNFMVASTWTQAQPESVVLVMKQIGWQADDGFCDGTSVNTARIYNAVSTPTFYINSGSGAAPNGGLAINTRGIVSVVFNGAASSSRVNDNAKVTGNAGTASAGGLTLGANGAPNGYSNIAVEEVIIFPSALSDADRNSVVTALNNALTVF